MELKTTEDTMTTGKITERVTTQKQEEDHHTNTVSKKSMTTETKR